MQTFKISNFLKNGAFLGWSNSWYLFQGPFESVSDVKQHSYHFGIQHFFDAQLCRLSATQAHVVDKKKFQELMTNKAPPMESIRWLGPNREDYKSRFKVFHEKLVSGELNKAVPFVFDRAKLLIEPQHILHMIQSISDMNYPHLIPYGYWNENEGVLGVTPEVLFHKKRNEISSMALAGTEKKTQAMGPTLQSDKKILKEHQFVVDELIEKWSKWGKVIVDRTQVMELPILYHLLTNLRIISKNEVSSAELISSLHPTSAVGVSPYSKWRELESLPGQKERNFYGAPLLFKLSESEEIAIVALRQVQWDKTCVRLGAGGGIVLQSQEETEWQEILAKIESVKGLLKI